MLQRLEQPTAAPFALRHLLGASLDAAKQAALQGIPPLAELQKLAAEWEQACSTPTDRAGPKAEAADPTGLQQRRAAPQAAQNPQAVQLERGGPLPFVTEATRLLLAAVHDQLRKGQAQAGGADTPGGRNLVSLLALCKDSAAIPPSAN